MNIVLLTDESPRVTKVGKRIIKFKKNASKNQLAMGEISKLVTNAIDTMFVPLKNGRYKVCVTDSSGCISCSLPRNHSLLGIGNSQEQSLINVFPNPKNGSFNIVGMSPTFLLKIFDSNGKQI